ncbi:MAG: potassium transporter TrkG, partial [Pseudomonadota bacterium]
MIQLRPIFFSMGLMLCTIAAAMVLPAVVDLADDSSGWRVFLSSAVFTFFIGGLLTIVSKDDAPAKLGVKEGFLLTTLLWIVLVAFAALPFAGLGLDYTDAFFEAMSGLTTTGSTVLTELDQLPRGILLWRALLQGLGGLGIIVMAIIMLPFLRVGGMQLFQMEQSDRSEKIVPRAGELVGLILSFYVGALIACTVLYATFGMTLFDAICHALTTVSTAGFSTHDDSFGFFQNPTLEWICIVFMIIGALPFVAFIKLMRGQTRPVLQDNQIRGFLIFLVIICLIMTAWLIAIRGMSSVDALRTATFNVTSIVTTSGYASADYTTWGAFSMGLFFL